MAMIWAMWMVGLIVVTFTVKRPLGEVRTVNEDASPELSTRLRLELVAAALDAGLPLRQAVVEVIRAEGNSTLEPVASRLDLGLAWDHAWANVRQHTGDPRKGSRLGVGGVAGRWSIDGHTDRLAAFQQALDFSAQTDSPASGLLRARVEHLRRREVYEAERLATLLGVRLVLPLGLCSLPALVCWGVLPVLLGLIPGIR
ncbi:type II secretion system protein [uncultured Kocuria sp.]|uniref:type II secretion system protein n=1 Tax=uncultured Kocuria sp. TaxID=259305 RepID=UPI002597D5AF|nr:type II secretion system protein [uncultured Kocuria sp.]MCT1367951.1 type II secretion system protein [Rothia sp. p3-SID1597]